MLNTDMVMVPREILKRSMDLLGCVGCSPEGAESDVRDAARLQEDIKPYAAASPAAPSNDLQQTAQRIESGEIHNAHFSNHNLVMCSKEHYGVLSDAFYGLSATRATLGELE